MIARFGAALLAALSVMSPNRAPAQVVDSSPPIRHILAMDFARVRPFRHTYDMVVASADSATAIGQRDVTFAEAVAGDSSLGWWLVESRSGAVSATDSILLAPDLRPLLWRSALGPARLEMSFTSDSMTGETRVGRAANRVAIAIPPDAIVSTTLLDVLAGLLPLAPAWSDSASALATDLAGAQVFPAELAVTGEDSIVGSPGGAPRAAWVLSATSGTRVTRLWVDRENGAVLREEMTLPSQPGAVLEYRLRDEAP